MKPGRLHFVSKIALDSRAMAALDASTELWRIHASQWYFKQGSVWVHSTNGPLQDRTIGPSKTVWCYADSVWHLWDGKQWVISGEPVHAEEPPMKKARVEVDSQQLEPHHWFVSFAILLGLKSFVLGLPFQRPWIL